MNIDELDIRLMTWGSVVLRFDELIAVLCHRTMVLFLALFWALLFPFFYAADSDVPFWQQLSAHLAVQLGVLALVMTAIGAVAVLERGRGRIVVRASVIVAVAMGSMVVAGQVIGQARGWVAPSGPGMVVALAVFAMLMGEVQASVAVNRLIPRVLAELRGAAGAAVVAEPVVTVAVGQKSVLLRDVLHVRAEGNYVEVTLRGGGRLFTLATLRSVVAQVPEGEGMLIHRSLWIATAAFAGYRRDGADLHVRTVDGREFKVARSRHGEVLPWLKVRAAETAGRAMAHA